MNTVRSQDGTTIAYDRAGEGPALILVGGALSVRQHPVVDQLVTALAPHFTVFSFDRRGRGDSGDTLPYAVEREVEDIEALIDAAGGSAFLYGMSSGAVLALEAAKRLGDKVKKLVMYEPPLILDDSRPPAPNDYVEQLNNAIAAGQPGDAVEIFMTKAILLPPEAVAQMRTGQYDSQSDSEMKPPEWQAMESVAHTLAYDGQIMEGLMLGKPLPEGRWAGVDAAALVVAGGNSDTFFHNGAQALVEQLPNAQYRVLEGQDHAVSPAALAPLLVEFLGQTEDTTTGAS
jgi:pimeloyl-ACP methyl ester carboxylesterase